MLWSLPFTFVYFKSMCIMSLQAYTWVTFCWVVCEIQRVCIASSIHRLTGSAELESVSKNCSVGYLSWFPWHCDAGTGHVVTHKYSRNIYRRSGNYMNTLYTLKKKYQHKKSEQKSNILWTLKCILYLMKVLLGYNFTYSKSTTTFLSHNYFVSIVHIVLEKTHIFI